MKPRSNFDVRYGNRSQTSAKTTSCMNSGISRNVPAVTTKME